MAELILREYDPQTGILTEMVDEDGKRVFKKSWDAEPYLKHAHEMRVATEGQAWEQKGHFGRLIGTIPPAELSVMLRQDGGYDKKRAMQWLKKNPAFVTFSKFLKNPQAK